MKTLVALLVAGLSAGALAQSATTPARQEVPVARVALFSSGVGYFEHAGIVHGNGTTELRFRTSQMNDVLKSLVVQDEGGGLVNAITYPSQDPVSKTLRSFQVDITANPSMAQLLNQLRGAKVTVVTQAEHLSGTILGVESRSRALDKDVAIDVAVLNLLSGPMIRSVELPSISSLTFDDPQLQDELTKALSTLNQSRDQDKKPVVIGFTGTGDRRVRLGYVVESPVWKTSYRLLLDEKGAKLQGWAIVENQTESDWNNVTLSLISGRPISFIMDLYAPKYLPRPTVVQQTFGSLQPQVYAGGIAVDAPVEVPPAPSSLLAGKVAGGQARGRIGFDANGRPIANQLSEVVVTGLDASASVQSMASTGQIGELFEYTVRDVSLPRQKSAMIPIVTDAIESERVSIYNANVLATNPLYGVRIKNTTGKSLLQGPVTVLDKGAYAGDAQVDNVPKGQDRLLSYGVDLDVVVNTTRDNVNATTSAATISKGVLMLTMKNVSTRLYTAENKSDHDKTLIIEHPVLEGATLVDTPKPFETTPAFYRFRVAAPAKKTVTFSVKEQNVINQTIALLSMDAGQLVMFSRNGEFPSNVRSALAKAIQLRQAVADLDRQIVDKNQQLNAITVEQNRIRENMKTVGQTSEYYQRLLGKLNEQESSIEKLQKDRDDLTARRDAARRELESYLSDLNVG